MARRSESEAHGVLPVCNRLGSLSLLLFLEHSSTPENKNEHDDQYDSYDSHNDANLLSVRSLVFCRLKGDQKSVDNVRKRYNKGLEGVTEGKAKG